MVRRVALQEVSSKDTLIALAAQMDGQIIATLELQESVVGRVYPIVVIPQGEHLL